jgi:hypothetical protein
VEDTSIYVGVELHHCNIQFPDDYSPHEHEILQHCQALYTRKVENLTPQQIRPLNGIYLHLFPKELRLGKRVGP